MDTTQIKQIAAKLSFIKNYSAFILPVVLTFIIFPALLVIGAFMSKNLKGDMVKQSVQKGEQLQSISLQNISRRQSEEEKEYMDAFEADMNIIIDLIRHTSQRELLSYKVFPKPKDTSVLIFKEFGKNYRLAVESLLEKYGTRQRPTDTEIKKALEQSSSPATTRSRGFGYRDRDYPTVDFGSDFTSDRLDSLDRKIVNSLCEATAKKASFFAKATDIAGYEFWNDASAFVGKEDSSRSEGEHYQYQSINQSVRECWFWQIGYWIIEDIFSTISAMNRDCNNVLDCPVKRLLTVSFGSSSNYRRSESSGRPDYVTQENPGLIPSFTNRKSDENLDVVHFKFSIIINSESILGFMKELCSVKKHTFKGWTGRQPLQTFEHNQITVLRANTLAVDKGSKDHEFHRYGDDAVVELELTCEYIFERQGYKYQNANGEEKIIMPDFIWNREDIDEDNTND